eukprot:TRINITY_DN9199_c0_g1_i3.p2 TRINITY_DN9199_c0_g1~~TRINITY_DN9199_c0_g1_i3.p2  ORF type:complete len:375 (+),score=71.52 TRINITY_DN9199_c0_g1_i3:1862-2986(+)
MRISGLQMLKAIKGHAKPCFAMHTAFETGQFATAGKDGIVKVWNAARLQEVDHIKLPGKELRSIAINRRGHYLIGTETSELYLAESKQQPKSIMDGHGEGELWALAVYPKVDTGPFDAATYFTGGDDKTIRVWSTRSSMMLKCIKTAVAVRSLDISPDGKLLLAGMINGSFAQYTVDDLDKPPQSKRDRGASLQVVSYSPCGQLLAVGSSDCCVDVYNTDLRRVSYCKTLSAGVTALDWTTDSRLVRVETEHFEVHFVHAQTGELVEEPEELNLYKRNGLLEQHNNGIWPPNAEKATVNCAAMAHGGSALATGDDAGLVKLFKCPVPAEHAKHLEYSGHSDHITRLAFTSDDAYLLSVGREDTCVLVWKCQHAK